MTALVIDLPRVRRAVDQSRRMGVDETQRQVVLRLVADARDRQLLTIGAMFKSAHQTISTAHTHDTHGGAA